MLTRNSPTTYYEDASGPAGLEYEMAKMFADELGVKLTLLIPESFNDLLAKISDNSAHITAAGLTITRDREKIYRFGPAYQEIIEQLVYNVGNKRPRSLSKLNGGSLEVVANSSHDERLKHLSKLIPCLLYTSPSPRDRS